MKTRVTLTVLLVVSLCAADAAAQFRRGMFGEAREITVFPVEPPALLLPSTTVEISTQNASTASARIVDRFRDLLKRQLTDNDARLRIVESGGDVVVAATLLEWNQSRRNSTKYVSERRQIGTRQVTDKDGKTRTEPVYEYGSNKPSVVINGAAGVRVEVRQKSGDVPLVDETARHTVHEEHLASAGPPSPDSVEDTLIDNVVQKAAGRITPGRLPVRVLLARSSEVDDLNSLAVSRRWTEWLGRLEDMKPQRDRRKEAYRLHNIAVAHECLGYEAVSPEESLSRLKQASTLAARANQQHPDEKYFVESVNRIARSISNYQRLAFLYQRAGVSAVPAAPQAAAGPAAAAPVAATPANAAPAESPAAAVAKASDASGPGAAPMSNQDVIDLRGAGLDDENLIASIKEARAVKFDLSPAGLRALLAAKVSNQVINAMRARARPK